MALGRICGNAVVVIGGNAAVVIGGDVVVTWRLDANARAR